MNTGINVMETPEKLPEIKEPPKPIPEIETSGVFDYPIKILKESINTLQSQKFKNTLWNDIDYFKVKLGVSKLPNNQNEFNSRELALRNEIISTGRQLSQKDMIERYNFLVDLYQNNENNIASVQMAIETLIKKS